MAGGHREAPAAHSERRAVIDAERAQIRGSLHLTAFEQVVGTVLWAGTLAVLMAVIPGARIWWVAPALSLAYLPIAEVYSTRSRPTYKPAFRRSSEPAAPRNYADSLDGRFRAFWRVPGRRGGLVVAAGVFVAFCGFAGAADDTALLSALRARGVSADAVVVRVDRSHGKGGDSLDNVSVQFDAEPGAPVTEDLGIIDSVPESIQEGDHVKVVYVPGSPDQVLLASAMGTDHVTWDYVVGGLGLLATVVGGVLWIGGRRKRKVLRSQ